MFPHPQVLLHGVLIGSVYGAAAIGFQLVVGATGRVHLAYGHVGVLAGLCAVALFSRVDIPFPLVPPALALAGWVLARALHPRAVWKPVEGDSEPRSFLLLALGCALVLEDLGGQIWSLPSTAVAMGGEPLRWKELTVSLPKLMAWIGSLGLAACAAFFLRSTRLGKALRAWDGGKGPIELVGADPCALGRLAVGLGFGVAGFAGCLLALTQIVSVQDGLPLTLRCMVLSVMAGTLSPGWLLTAGWLLGAGEAWISHLLGSQWHPALGYGLLLAVLRLREAGGKP